MLRRVVEKFAGTVGRCSKEQSDDVHLDRSEDAHRSSQKTLKEAIRRRSQEQSEGTLMSRPDDVQKNGRTVPIEVAKRHSKKQPEDVQ